MSTTSYRYLRCASCGKIITRLSYEALKFPQVHRCCSSVNLQPYSFPEKVGE